MVFMVYLEQIFLNLLIIEYAELTTAFGRKVLQYMRETAKEVYGFEVIYGDTDSIFVTNIIEYRIN